VQIEIPVPVLVVSDPEEDKDVHFFRCHTVTRNYSYNTVIIPVLEIIVIIEKKY
jgi:hypothetical protein